MHCMLYQILLFFLLTKLCELQQQGSHALCILSIFIKIVSEKWVTVEVFVSGCHLGARGTWKDERNTIVIFQQNWH